MSKFIKRNTLVRRVINEAGLTKDLCTRSHGYLTRLQLMELLIKIQEWKGPLNNEQAQNKKAQS
jgi:hypothetical protein